MIRSTLVLMMAQGDEGSCRQCSPKKWTSEDIEGVSDIRCVEVKQARLWP